MLPKNEPMLRVENVFNIGNIETQLTNTYLSLMY